MTLTDPSDWYFEAPDYDVNAGGYWVHEKGCTLDLDDDDQEITDEYVGGRFEGESMNRRSVILTRLTCNCGAQTEIEESHYDPDDEAIESAEDEIDYWDSAFDYYYSPEKY